jgi:hypothetical protein
VALGSFYTYLDSKDGLCRAVMGMNVFVGLR